MKDFSEKEREFGRRDKVEVKRLPKTPQQQAQATADSNSSSKSA
jgi:hypothetical protein